MRFYMLCNLPKFLKLEVNDKDVIQVSDWLVSTSDTLNGYAESNKHNPYDKWFPSRSKEIIQGTKSRQDLPSGRQLKHCLPLVIRYIKSFKQF